MTATSEKHTPGVLRCHRSIMPHDGEYDYAISTDGALVLAESFGRDANGRRLPAEANAARIVLTWNCHDELVAAAQPLADCVFGFGGPDHEYISVTAGELRALAAALSRATSPTP